MRENDRPMGRAWDIVVAGSLLTRLPWPHAPKQAFSAPARAVWAYPLIGALLGGLAVIFGLGLLWLGLPAMLAAGSMLVLYLLMTGAMHEDGLADTADGLWGGWTAERRLEIMKDSHIGSYGVLALIMVTGLRWSALTALLPISWAGVVTAAILSRTVMPLLMAWLPQARTTGLARSVGQPGAGLTAGTVCAGGLAAIVLTGPAGLLAFVMALVTAVCVGLLARAKIGGVTGDILGATQQLSETVVLIALIALLT